MRNKSRVTYDTLGMEISIPIGKYSLSHVVHSHLMRFLLERGSEVPSWSYVRRLVVERALNTTPIRKYRNGTHKSPNV